MVSAEGRTKVKAARFAGDTGEKVDDAGDPLATGAICAIRCYIQRFDQIEAADYGSPSEPNQLRRDSTVVHEQIHQNSI